MEIATPVPDAAAQAHADEFLADVIDGLSRPRKALPCRWLYDQRGSELFEAITRLPEYYPTRVETGILADQLEEIARFAGPRRPIVEYGAGSGRKSELLISAIHPETYLPVDISQSTLAETAERLADRFPGTRVLPVTADFMADFALPDGVVPRRTVFFPGSTIGNLDDAQIDVLLRRMHGHAGPGGRAIIGIDLRKPLDVLLPAYADAAGVTAQFNSNLLVRANRELGADFDLAAFTHEARWNEAASAVEMHLVSTAPQQVHLAGQTFAFAPGETIHTETSRKFDLFAFRLTAERCGWSTARTWTDRRQLFALIGLTNS